MKCDSGKCGKRYTHKQYKKLTKKVEKQRGKIGEQQADYNVMQGVTLLFIDIRPAPPFEHDCADAWYAHAMIGFAWNDHLQQIVEGGLPMYDMAILAQEAFDACMPVIS